MKSYTFSGNYKKNNEKEAFFTNIPFIETQVVPTLKQLQFSGKLPKELHFLDTSCGDNRVVEKLSSNDIIKTFVLYDLFFTFENSFQKDWLREKYKKDKKINLIGFNPPYGFNATTAKQFICKGFKEKYEYCVWLVPISLEKYLESLYKPIFKKQYCNELFENKKDDAKVKTIKQSVVFFVGKKREKQIILSGKKVGKLNIKGIKITRGHYKGINENVDVIIKKTGNPVLIPFFVKNKDNNTWTQFNKEGIVSREVPLIEKENGYYITGISKTKHTTKIYDYSVDSNVYFKLENVRNSVDINLFIKELLETANKEEFYVFTNRYKPASITKGWFENFIFNFITKCK